MRYLQNVLKESALYPHFDRRPRLTQCLKALRLYPPVPVNTRTAVRTTVLPVGGGADGASPFTVSRGCAIAFSTYAMHRRPDIYGEDAEEFRPDRWDEDMPMKNSSTDSKWGYLPFNGGPRICLGSTSTSFNSTTLRSHQVDTNIRSVIVDFALTEAAYVVVQVLKRFPSITLPQSETVELVVH